MMDSALAPGRYVKVREIGRGGMSVVYLARDLHQAENHGGADDVDVLLPIGGRSAPVAAAEGTIVLRPEFNDGEPLSLDLDLSGADAAAAAAPAVPPIDLALTEPPPDEPAAEDFWGNDPDARPTR